MGSRSRDAGRLRTQVLQNVQPHPAGTNQTGQILKGKLGQRIHSTIPITHGLPFLLLRQDGKLRPCQDYRYLNDHTIKNAYPLPLISELLNKLKGVKYFTKLDVRWGYNNVRIRDGDQIGRA